MSAPEISARLENDVLGAAITFLEKRLADEEWSSVNRWPTIVELARQARVGKAAMARAVRVLVKRGSLKARRRQGITLPQNEPPLRPATVAQNKVERVAGELVRHLLAGSYGPNHELPSLKELQAQYGVCFRTMKRSIDSLVHEEILSVGHRGYRLRTPPPGLSSNALVMIMGRELERVLPAYSYARSFYYPLLHALERDCSRRNLRLEVDRFPENPAGVRHDASVVGYFVALDATPDKETIDLVNHLLSFRVPVIVMRETDHPYFESIRPKPELVFLECSGEMAGFDVGQMLIANGHTSAAYLTYMPDKSWSQDRGRGLDRAFRVAGLSRAVTHYTLALGDRLPPRLLESDASAWVACDDVLATDVLLPRLRELDVVPGTSVSVIGFNDQLEAFEDRLTSYNFNTDALAAAVLFHVQFPERRLRRAATKAHQPVFLGGYIVDRGSVRRATPSARHA